MKTSHTPARGLLALVLFTTTALAWAGAPEPRLAIHDGPLGATCAFFDSAAGVSWKHRMGDWRDADGTAQGERAFATSPLPKGAPGQKMSIDVTRLVQGWQAGDYPNHGMLLRRATGARGVARFASAQALDQAARPVLEVRFADGGIEQFVPAGDVTLVCSTVRSLGTLPTLRVGDDTHALLRFALPAVGDSRKVKSATLILTTTGQQYGAPVIGAYRLEAPVADPGAIRSGLAAAYPGDKGIERDPAVWLAEGFESGTWTRNWSYTRRTDTFEPVAVDEAARFEPLFGKALRVRVAKGEHYGLNSGYRFRDKTGSEPEEVYFRYYLRFGDDWKQTRDGGKMPGIAATYDKAGWGGRKSDGTNGWSMRGGFAKAVPDGHVLEGGTLLGTYAYLPGNDKVWGAFWPWSADFPGVLFNNRWYCIEQYVRVNTPGKEDGELRVWIDGRPSLVREGLRMRDVDEIRIQEVWLNIYHGGSAVSPRDQHLFIDNVVIAKKYIGPVAR